MPGEPFRLRRWQERRIIRPLFATDPATGRRPIPHLSADDAAQEREDASLRRRWRSMACCSMARSGGEVYSAAADKDQAALVFNVAAQMIRNDAELSAACEIVDSQKRIVHRKSGSVYRAISRRGLQQARIQRVAA